MEPSIVVNVQVAKVESGDVLFVSVPEDDCTEPVMDRLRKVLRRTFPDPAIKIVLFSDNVTVRVTRGINEPEKRGGE